MLTSSLFTLKQLMVKFILKLLSNNRYLPNIKRFINVNINNMPIILNAIILIIPVKHVYLRNILYLIL